MSRFSFGRTAINLVAPLLIICSGCGSEPHQGAGPPVAQMNPWLGIPSACKVVMVCVNDGTNWMLNKNQVDVVKVSEVRSNGLDTFAAEYRITVNNGTSSFETIAQEVACDKHGIPTEESVSKLREAVEDIKAKIKRLQN